MKKFLLITFLALIIIYENTFSQNVKVEDYQVPISRAKLLRMNGYWNWNQVGDSVTNNAAAAGLIYRQFYSSLPFAWFFDADLSGGKSFSQYQHSIKISSSARKYIWDERDFFAFAGLELSHLDYYKQVASNLTLGAGYGRYIDATALAKAVRIEEHLLREKIITDRLPKTTMIKIANIIDRQSEYINIYGETYENFWLFDIENEIRASGMLIGNHVGAIGILRIRQVLFNINEKVNNRYFGYDVNVGSKFILSTFDKSKSGSPNLSLSGRYSYPLGWRFQINGNFEIFSPMDSMFFRQVTSNIGVDFIYELSNRINFVANYKVKAFKQYGQSKFVIDHIFTTSFLYYLENEIYYGLSTSIQRIGTQKTLLGLAMTVQYNLF
ncbi:MAG: hypothetical protein N3F03_01905 [Ignavibacteria bacterium]|nr:hypothetical protein [Ignavibacteria bacterium]